MIKRTNHSKKKYLNLVLLATCLCNLQMQADSYNLGIPDQNQQSCHFYSLDEPIENVESIPMHSLVPATGMDEMPPYSIADSDTFPLVDENPVFDNSDGGGMPPCPNLFPNSFYSSPEEEEGPPTYMTPYEEKTPKQTPQQTEKEPAAPTEQQQPKTQTPATETNLYERKISRPGAAPTTPAGQGAAGTSAQTPSTETPGTTPPTAPGELNQPALTPPPQINPNANPLFQPPTSPAPVNPNLMPGVPHAAKPGTPPSATGGGAVAGGNEPPKSILINFNNVAITEYIRFISRISNKNFVFDENDLQFTVTIVSEEPTTIDNIMTALLQELRIHDLELMEQDNTIIIHRNNKVSSISKVVPEDTNVNDVQNADIVTKVFRLNTLEADRAAVILKPLVSATALVEVLKQTNHLIITDLSSNVREISALLKSLDSPQSGLVIGQYVVTTQPIDALIALSQRIILPLAEGQKIIFIPHKIANSIFIVSNPYLVERTISILRYLDQTAAATQILNPRDLNFSQQGVGQWILDKNGNWQFIPGSPIHGGAQPQGNWKIDDQGNWYFEPGEPSGGKGPDGKWVLDKDGNWVFQLAPGKSISPQKVQRKEKISSELPVGHIERTQFSLYKLQFRKGEQIARALGRIAESLAASGTNTNADLLGAINSVQWIESSNSLIFTGTADAITKMKELIATIDVPLRQVLLEMLILETDISDSLNFSTNVASRFGGGNTAGAEAFLSGASTLPAGIASSGVGLIPDAGGQISNVTGFVLGVIGQTITHNGTEFATLGALVKALSTRTISKIVMNPKILTEDNSPAELFVGLNTQFPTQSIANNLGTILTQNFEFRDVGTTLKVTPIIGSNDIVTLEIQEEVSSVVSGGVQASTTLSNQVIGPTTKINRTTTRVHVPNRFFLILSGMLSDTEERVRTQVPCLGSVPVIGAAFSDKQLMDTKQNLMIFIHPIIIDTEEEIDNITRHEQNIYRVKSRRPKEWTLDTDEAMDFFNIIDTENSDGTEDCY
jgi:type III secretion protein C